jgi:hypothetical protein
MFLDNTLNHLILLLSVIGISLLFTLIHYFFFKNKGPWGRIWALFLVVLLVDWTIGLWYFLIVDTAEGIPWLLLVFIGFVTILLIGAANNPVRERHYRTYDEENKEVIVQANPPEKVVLTRNLRYWMLLGFLSLSILAGYIKIYFP